MDQDFPDNQLPSVPITPSTGGQQDDDDAVTEQQQQQGASASQSSYSDVPETAEDIDLIEKAWVEKAKSIVNSTVGDPHTQSEKINNMKAEYIKKRYNKDIKATE